MFLLNGIMPVPKKAIYHFVIISGVLVSWMYIMGKLFSRMINDKLQVVVEEVVSDIQCGFRTGRDSVDMILCVCQLVAKLSHRTQHQNIFIVCGFL